MKELRLKVKADSKGRITIPQHIRESLSIGTGTYFEMVVDLENKQIVLKPLIKGKSEGVILDVVVRVNTAKDLYEIMNTCIEGGYDIISFNCIHGEFYECVLSVYAIDEEQASKLKGLLYKYLTQ
jgi:AbrB family looped-hinge helix DNA binding protein